MEIEESECINEKIEEKIEKENEKKKEEKKEKNREYQRAWRQRKKDLKEKNSKEEKEIKKRKRHSLNQMIYYQRKKGLDKNDENVEELSEKKLDDLQMKKKRLDSNEDEENVVRCRASQNLGAAIGGTTVHNSLSISLSRLLTLNIDGRVGNAQVEDSNTAKNQKRSTTHREDLSIELKQLSENPLQTITKKFFDFISKNNRLSIFSFNCQSLHGHVDDLAVDALVKKINVLMLSETHMSNDKIIDIPNFNFVVSFRRSNRPAGGVAIYQNENTVHYCTNYMDVHAKYTSMFNTTVSDIGDICISRCHTGNNEFIIMVAVYISPGKSLEDIRNFLFENLLIYSHTGSALLQKEIGKRFDDLPMILSGDFNINFADDKNETLIEFLNNKFGLTMSNDRNLSTTKHKTTIGAVFTRNLDRFKSELFVSYFSYHKPIVSVLEIGNDDAGNDDGERVVEIMDES